MSDRLISMLGALRAADHDEQAIRFRDAACAIRSASMRCPGCAHGYGTGDECAHHYSVRVYAMNILGARAWARRGLMVRYRHHNMESRVHA